MWKIAIKMLMGDRSKYFTLVSSLVVVSFLFLQQVILMLAPELPQMPVFMVISGIIGQCLHVYKARVSYRVLAGVDSHSAEYIEMVSKHIAHLTALGLRGLEREKGAS